MAPVRVGVKQNYWQVVRWLALPVLLSILLWIMAILMLQAACQAGAAVVRVTL